MGWQGYDIQLLLTSAIFIVTVAAIVARLVDETVAALAGLVLMIVLTEYGPLEAFHIIDWNVLAILLGMWIITAYMIEGGVAERAVEAISRRVRDYRLFLVTMILLAGFISMFVDNVLVILLFGSVVLEAAKRNGANAVMAILMVGFAANFMGTALLLGDLPPQLLHSVAGAEFLDFIWHAGKPSSFPLLTVTFLAVVAAMYYLFIRREPSSFNLSVGEVAQREPWRSHILAISLAGFLATVAGMAARPLLGVPLGFITVAGAAATSLAAEVYRRVRGEGPSFEEVVGHVEWRALLFYATLFGLVGGLEENHVLERIAEHFTPFLEAGLPIAYTVFYWVVALLSTIVEHDALLLTFLYIVRDAAQHAGVDAWPLYWAMAWSATLASNATVAAAPALYVAVTLAEEKGYRVPPSTFLRYSVPFAGLSLAIHYLVTLPLWGLG